MANNENLAREALKTENTKAQMRKGVLEMCILGVISGEELYTSDIIKRLKEADLLVVEGTVYPLLTRLKNGGLLEYKWIESSTGPPRKYYKITPEGENLLNELLESWAQLVKAVSQTTNNQ
ncbi:MAG TPA: PadR family transcriptional regulator [Saprospiraceae bacterium]|nr:PadR family transcriptional regulator [Saprospiraceae bacterium]